MHDRASRRRPTAAVRRAWQKEATITDPEALLRALDRAAEPAPRASAPPPATTGSAANALSALPVPPPPPCPTPRPALAPNEAIVRMSAGGAVVIRRRSTAATEAAA